MMTIHAMSTVQGVLGCPCFEALEHMQYRDVNFAFSDAEVIEESLISVKAMFFCVSLEPTENSCGLSGSLV